jgi:hypothetical protein
VFEGRRKVATWWACLKAIAVFNILLWAVTCLPLAGGKRSLSWHVALSGVYVAVCAFRSWRPRVDVERYCLVDSPLSSVFVGRTAATIAEVCFAVQVALVLHQVGVVAHVPWIVTASYLVVPPLVLAQAFCWHSVLTLSHLGHAIEESLWTATLSMTGVCLAIASTRLDGGWFWLAAAWAVLAAGFAAFMTLVDIPMYVSRWRRARRERQPVLSLRDGLMDARSRRVLTTEWVAWRPEVAWLTGYFSVAVWISLSFVYLSR